MSKHTPGPWAVHHDPDWCQWSVHSANAADLAEKPVYYVLAERVGGHIRGEDFADFSEVEANARLIAAAPDLLESLVSALEELRAMKGEIGFRANTLDVIRRCEATIAKARGEA